MTKVNGILGSWTGADQCWPLKTLPVLKFFNPPVNKSRGNKEKPEENRLNGNKNQREARAFHELQVNFLSWVNFRNQQQGEPIRTFLREPMGEYITKSQSQRRCHCYGPVRAPALWFLGGSHREDFGGGPSGAAPRPAALVSGLVPSLHISARGSRRRARVLVGAAAALGPGPSHSLLLRRGLGGAARCSRRALPLRIPPLTGTSPLSPQQTRKVRLSPVSRPGGRRADAAVSFWGRGGCGVLARWGRARSWPMGDSSPLLPPGLPRGPSGRGWGVGNFPSDSVSFWFSLHRLVAGFSGELTHLEGTHGTPRFYF